MTSMYALGWTQHSKGSQNIRAMAMLQLILGNIGVRGGGMNALRGHSNIQGLTDLGLMSNLLPGYLTLPTEQEPDFATYMSTRGFKPLRPDQMSYWQNYKKFFVSFQKSMWGTAATAENDWAYDCLPKLDVPAYDVLRAFELMHQGKMNGYFCQGFNPLLSFPNTAKITAALSKLKFLVIMDPLQTETARFWENHGEHNDVDPAEIQTEVFELPTHLLRRGRGLARQLRALAAMALGRRHAAGRGQVRRLDHGAALPAAEGALPEGGRARSPTRSSTCTGPTRTRTSRRRTRSPRRSTATSSADVPDPADATKIDPAEGQAGRRASRRCATTARPRAAAGSTPAASPRRATTWPAATTRDPDDTGAYLELGVLVAGQPPHPLQPRLGGSAAASRGIRAAS